jgi:hypothetical protein
MSNETWRDGAVCVGREEFTHPILDLNTKDREETKQLLLRDRKVTTFINDYATRTGRPLPAEPETTEGYRELKNLSVDARNEIVTTAKRVCETCPVLTMCAAWARRDKEFSGVTAGLTVTEWETTLNTPRADIDPTVWFAVTDLLSEDAVAALCEQGWTTKQIANKYNVAERTIVRYRAKIKQPAVTTL